LAVLHAELEALRDGVRSLTPDAVRSLQAEVATLTALVNDLYDLALVDAGEATYQQEPVDLAELVHMALHAFAQRFAQRDITVDTKGVSSAPVMVRGDSRRLTQLLNNLLENTHRYTDPGGRVEVALRGTTDGALLQIEDSAPGVPADLLPRLFERLFRVETSRNRASGGAGLGLSLCRSIVDAHHGEISASASALGGLKMQIRLPRLHA
jgi:two-component system sensor histidine kinase BaeS